MFGFITFFKEAGQAIHDNITLLHYCKSESQDSGKVSSVLVSMDRSEFYLYDYATCSTVASIFMVKQEDMHFGKVACAAALFIKKEYRGKPMVNRMVRDLMGAYAKANGCAYYQRSKHLTPYIQLLITKEVPHGRY